MKKRIPRNRVNKKSKVKIIPSLGIKLGFPTNSVELVRKLSRGR